MPEVLVQAELITPTTGTTIIDREMIENLPTRDGNINEIVGIVPGVQFAEESFNSFTAGEISPPVVSISGSRYYDNNYTINGISNNNPLDPAFDSTTGAGKLPGHPQIHFLNSQIIDQITVYNSNIPAEFGGFTGGQIDVKTISPDNVSSGSIHYRTTEDSWTKFHIHPDHLDDFYNSKTTDKQPEFRKQAFGLNFNLPIGNDTGLVTAYEQQRSKIPLQHLDGYNTQTRRQENFFLKAEHYLPSGAELALTALYSPTDNQYFMTETKGSDYSIEGHNLSFGLSYENQLAAGDLLSNLTYTSQQTRRDAAPNRLFWDASQPAIDWDSGREGGLGVLETGHKEISLSSDFTTNKLMLGRMDHQIKFGATATHSRQHYFRPLTNYLYYTSVVDSLIICDAGDPACINSEQYLSKRTAYLEADRTADISDYAGYIQNNIAWKRLEIFPGLRVSYDDYTNNVNLAPRLSLSLDLFGDRDTIFFGGRNRYYSGTLLTHALYSGYVTESQSRSTSGNGQDDWVTTSVIYSYGEDSVKTPYT
ncbi:MAG: TonB-dependent receptor [Deltaproteobacteria bacterium]|nr:TonB-dependent receptor [Deltaproteobacteria bacterium]